MKKIKRPTRKLHGGLTAWQAKHYDRAADAVMNELHLTTTEWGDVRFAIRMALEGKLKHYGVAS